MLSTEGARLVQKKLFQLRPVSILPTHPQHISRYPMSILVAKIAKNQYNFQSTFCINFALPMPTLPCQFSNKIRSIYSSILLGVPTCFVLTYPMISLGPLAKKQPRVLDVRNKKYGSILKPVTTSVQRHDDSNAHALTSKFQSFGDLCTKSCVTVFSTSFRTQRCLTSNEHEWAILVHLVVVPLLYQKVEFQIGPAVL